MPYFLEFKPSVSKSSKVKIDSSVMSKLLEGKSIKLQEFRPGDLIQGVVVKIGKNEVLVDVGAKSEAILAMGPAIPKSITVKPRTLRCIIVSSMMARSQSLWSSV